MTADSRYLPFALAACLATSTVQAQLPDIDDSWVDSYWYLSWDCAPHASQGAYFHGEQFRNCEDAYRYVQQNYCHDAVITRWECSKRSTLGTSWWAPARGGISLGNSGPPLVIGSSGRFQQIQRGTDLRAGPIREIAWMADETVPSVSGSLDLEIWMSHSDRSTATPVFANNYGADLTQVLSRRTIPFSAAVLGHSSPPIGNLLAGAALDVPFLHDGQSDVLIEVRIHSITGRLALDQVTTASVPFGYFDSGFGCDSGGGQMKLGSVTHPVPGATWALQTSNAPAASLGAVLVGLQTTPFQLPGLCGSVMTQSYLDLPITTDGTGRATLSLPVPPTVQPATLAMQAAVLGGPAQVAASHGALIRIGDPIRPTNGVLIRGTVTSQVGSMSTAAVQWSYR